jgi:hypothetical protein
LPLDHTRKPLDREVISVDPVALARVDQDWLSQKHPCAVPQELGHEQETISRHRYLIVPDMLRHLEQARG